jgi:hypothetical protein
MDRLQRPPGFEKMSDRQRWPYYRARSLWLISQVYPDDPEKVEAHMRDVDERNGPLFLR